MSNKTILVDQYLPIEKYGCYYRLVEIKDAEFIMSLRTNEKLSRYINETNNKLKDQSDWLKDYKLREAQRNRKNDRWSSTIDPSCGLLKNRYLIYFCASNGRYYKAYESDHKREYRELSTSEVKNLGKGKD